MVAGLRAHGRRRARHPAALHQRRARTPAVSARRRPPSSPASAPPAGWSAGGSLLMDDDAVFALAADLEGHPDNVAPALYGGFTVAYRDGDRFRATTLAVDPRVGGRRVRAARRRRDVRRAWTAAARRCRTRTRPPTPDGPPCSSPRSGASPSCCSPRPRTGCTRSTASPPCPPPSSSSACSAPTVCRRWCPAPVRPSWCSPTRIQQRAVAGRCPEGWAALTVPIDRYGARVDLPE